jgi:aryl-alcohol dehydrogenase-like predicted oxidoreductase
VSDADARATVEQAGALGVRSFDAGPHFGLGLSAQRLGAALANLPDDEYVVSTKVGRLLEPAERAAGLDDQGSRCPRPIGVCGTSAGAAGWGFIPAFVGDGLAGDPGREL